MQQQDPSDPSNFFVGARLVDRAQFWINQGPGSDLAVSSLLGLTAYLLITQGGLVKISPAMPTAVGRMAAWLAAAICVVDAVALAGILIGYSEASAADADPARAMNTGLVVQSHAFVLCCVVGILTGVVAWLLWKTDPPGPRPEHKATDESDMVTILATTAMRISEVSGVWVGDVDLASGLIHVRRQTYPGRGGLVTKETLGRRRRVVPIIAQLRPTLARLTSGKPESASLILGPRGGVITTATLRDATDWDHLVASLGLSRLVRHGSRHTALRWMADSRVPLHVLQRVAGHQDPAVTSVHLHPDSRALLAAGSAFSAWWSMDGPSDDESAAVIPLAARAENRP